MDRNSYSNDKYTSPHVPPATPPVIDDHADPADAILANDNGDSDWPGSQPAHFQHGRGGDEAEPGARPDELQPGRDDQINPASPDEIESEPGDVDEPGSIPDETPARPDAAPLETPPPPD